MDTPGLFGFKERIDADTGAIERYKDITEKRVSEAHLVLYVMGSANPIKESHREELVWLFRTLNLLPRTVFVLSRFDEVADVEDEGEYQETLAVKRANVAERLRDLLDLGPQEVAALSIVGVAANPFDLGTEHWLSDLVRFRALSRIATLQSATSAKVATNGGTMAIVDQARASIVRDVLSRQLPVAIENDLRVGAEVDRLLEMNSRLKEQLIKVEADVMTARLKLRRFVLDHFTDLILQANNASLDTITGFFEREIGSDGIVLNTKLQDEFDRQIGLVESQIIRMSVDFDSEINHFNSAMSVMGKQGLGYLIKGNVVNSTSVLAVRDGVVAVAKAVGVDLGSVLKFKPWGAVNLTKGLNGALAVLGLALEVWDSWEQARREEAFRTAISSMVRNFEEQRKELIELLDGARFGDRYFPDYVRLKASALELQKSVEHSQSRREAFRTWRAMGEKINAEFAATP